jgi:uncharacterized protein YbjT (DUF2867 family)
MEKGNKIALVAGASGLVGREIVQLLSKDEGMAEVRVLVRRPLPAHDTMPRVREMVTDYDRVQEHPEWFKVDLVFSALGTTIAKARSQQAFRRVDFEYALAVAKLARAQGAQHILFVSALGADSRSAFFYNRVKGELEDAVLGLGYPSVSIARPSLLLGQRQERRWGEELAKRFAWLLPAKWAGVQPSQVAAGLVAAAHRNFPGVQILENKALREIPVMP